jgi:hypothetical protein
VNHGFWERAGGDTGQKYGPELVSIMSTALRAITLGLILVLVPAPTQAHALCHSLLALQPSKKQGKGQSKNYFFRDEHCRNQDWKWHHTSYVVATKTLCDISCRFATCGRPEQPHKASERFFSLPEASLRALEVVGKVLFSTAVTTALHPLQLCQQETCSYKSNQK